MILDDILKARQEQLMREKALVPFDKMKAEAKAKKDLPPDFGKALSDDSLSFICEVKRASPSKGMIAQSFHPIETACKYERCGAAAISCLTEEHYFKGSNAYLKEIAEAVNIPVLRKDFITNPYQIYHARVLGAAAVLLIAAVLNQNELSELLSITHDLGISALVEVHNEQELEKALRSNARIIGVNNRDLKTFNVSLDTTKRLFGSIPSDKIKVSESGIKTNEDAKMLKSFGADAVLIGETLMRSNDIKQTFSKLSEGV